VLALVGARPLMEATGRVVKYELIPLDELGRPRVDVLASLSGYFPPDFLRLLSVQYPTTIDYQSCQHLALGVVTSTSSSPSKSWAARALTSSLPSQVIVLAFLSGC